VCVVCVETYPTQARETITRKRENLRKKKIHKPFQWHLQCVGWDCVGYDFVRIGREVEQKIEGWGKYRFHSFIFCVTRNKKAKRKDEEAA
jgi:hypothetical protein